METQISSLKSEYLPVTDGTGNLLCCSHFNFAESFCDQSGQVSGFGYGSDQSAIVIVMMILLGHPPELSDSAKRFLIHGSSYEFEIDLALKSKHFLINFKYMTNTICE